MQISFELKKIQINCKFLVSKRSETTNVGNIPTAKLKLMELKEKEETFIIWATYVMVIITTTEMDHAVL